jgi:hypothetical protein
VRINASQPAGPLQIDIKKRVPKTQVALRYQSRFDREEDLRAEAKFIASRISLIKNVFILLQNDVNV